MEDPAHLRPLSDDQPIVLIAEDEVVVRNVAKIALERAGYFVLTASDGEEALTVARVFPGEIHLLLSDVHMPKIDGLQLRDHIAAERPGTVVLLMSGKMTCGDGSPFLPKPFSPAGLVEAVRKLIR